MSAVSLRAALSCVVLLSVFTALHAQSSPVPRPPAQSGGGDGIVSPSVLATYRTRAVESDLQELEILVLWRGRPGWYTTKSPGGGGGGSVGRGGTWTRLVRQGGLELTLRVEAENKRAFIQGLGVDMRDANVFLVDQVDEAPVPIFIDSFHVEARLPFIGGPEQLLPVLKVLPDVRAFLRCAAVPAGRPLQSSQDLCARLP
jgi:hypothetical protein